MSREIKLLYVLALVTCAAIACGLGGCATMDVQDGAPPTAAEIQVNIVNEEKASMAAEGSWLVLDTIDTMQTARIAREPSKYQENDPVARALYGGRHPKEGVVIGVNVALAFGHTLVTSWLDDEVAAREVSDPHGTLGAWYSARVAWHVLSLLGSGAAVANNYSLGITP